MQCYEYLAAVAAVANAIDTIPGEAHKIPYSVLADWMAQNDIEAEDLLDVSGAEIKALVEEMIQQDHPQMPHAA